MNDHSWNSNGVKNGRDAQKSGSLCSKQGMTPGVFSGVTHDASSDAFEPKGFTLLEIMVVLVVLALGLAVLAQLAMATRRLSSYAQEQTEVQICCQNIMNQILSGEIEVTPNMTLSFDSLPNWEMFVSVESGRLENILSLKIVGQKYKREQIPLSDGLGSLASTKIPISAQQIVLIQWVRHDAIKFQSASLDASQEEQDLLAGSQNPQLSQTQLPAQTQSSAQTQLSAQTQNETASQSGEFPNASLNSPEASDIFPNLQAQNAEFDAQPAGSGE